MIYNSATNQTLETNRRPALAFGSGGQFGSTVRDPACVPGGGRSALR